MGKLLIIGEKIISSSNKVKEILEQRNREKLLELAREQIEAGASALDINAAMLMDEEEDALVWAADTIIKNFSIRLSVDTPREELLKTLGSKYGEKVILNSISADPGSIEGIAATVRDKGASVIIILKNREGIPEDSDGRFKLAEESASLLERSGIKPGKVFFDPVVTSIGTSLKGAETFLRTVNKINIKMPDYKTIGGLSNVSFGLPLRPALNRTFLAMAVAMGVSAVICDPTDRGMQETIRTAEAVAGMDSGCAGLLKYYRSGRADNP